LETVRPVGTDANERFLKNWRQVTAFLATVRAFGRFTFSAAELADFKPDALSNDLLASTWEFVKSRAGSQLNWKQRKGRGFIIEVCREAAASYSLSGVDTVERSGSSGTKHSQPLPSDFVERVQAALPAQPWKPGVHRDVASQLGCRSDAVYDAIQQLIASGRRNVQKDGVVYASDGSVLARDDERVSASETKASG